MARTWHRTKQLTRQTTQSTSAATVHTLSITNPVANTDYWILWSLKGDYNVTSRNSRWMLRDVTAAADMHASICNRPNNTGNLFSVGGVARWQSGSSPTSPQEFSITYWAGNSADTVGADDIYIVAIKAETGDQFAVSSGTSSNTTSTLSDKVTLTFTPPAQKDYLVFVWGELGGTTTSTINGICRAVLEVDGTDYYFDTDDGLMAGTASARWPWSAAGVLNLTAVSHTLKIRFASTDGTTSASIGGNACILAIPVDTFSSEVYDFNVGEQSTTGTTSYVSAAAVSPTLSEDEYLVIVSGILRHSTSASSNQAQLDINGGVRSESSRTAIGSGGVKRTAHFSFGYETLSGSSPIDLEFRTSDSGHTARMYDAFVGVFGMAYTLAIGDAANAQTADNSSLSQVHALTVADAADAQMADNITLSQSSSLAVADASDSQAADNLSLSQVHALSADGSTNASTSESLVFTQTHLLNVAGSTDAQAADSVTLTQVHSVVVAGSTDALVSDSVNLTQIQYLGVGSAVDSLSSDEVSLGGASSVSVDDASDASTSENVSLSQIHFLYTADATNAQTADNAAAGTSTVVADSSSPVTSDTLVFTQAHSITVSDAASGSASDAAPVSQVHLIAVSGSNHASSSDNVVLEEQLLLVSSDAAHASASDAIVFQAFATLVRGATSAVTSDNASVAPAHTILGNDAYHELFDDDIVIRAIFQIEDDQLFMVIGSEVYFLVERVR